LLTPFSIFIISFCLLNFGFVCSFFPRNWGASLGYLFDIALFVNVGIHSYNLSSWHYLCCVPIILINYILFSFGSRKFYPPPFIFDEPLITHQCIFQFPCFWNIVGDFFFWWFPVISRLLHCDLIKYRILFLFSYAC
jgi:hypothetical protein